MKEEMQEGWNGVDVEPQAQRVCVNVCVCVCVFNGGEATAEKLLSDFKNLLSHATHYKQVENLKKGEVNVKK
jgi:hypothetical protein